MEESVVKISWKDKITNTEVLKRVMTKDVYLMQ